jgi:phytoene dehydrogenase-like protein
VYRELEAGRIPDEDLVYVTNASNKDPGGTHLAPQGCTNLQIMTLVPREHAIWNVADDRPVDPRDYHRDPEYRRRKSELTERLIGAAERVVPGIGRHIEWKESASPVTQERFTHSTGGTSYGIEFAVDQMGPMRIGPETDVPGLFLTGASTPSGHGIASVMRSGVVAAGAVLRRNLMKSVITGEVLGDPGALPDLQSGWDSWRACH